MKREYWTQWEYLWEIIKPELETQKFKTDGEGEWFKAPDLAHRVGSLAISTLVSLLNSKIKDQGLKFRNQMNFEEVRTVNGKYRRICKSKYRLERIF